MIHDTYQTTDLHVAAYCMLRGAKLVDVRQGEGRKALIILDNEGDRAFQASREFFSNELLVPIHHLLRLRSLLIGRIRDMREEVAA